MDESFTIDQMQSLALGGRRLKGAGIEFMTAPAAGAGRSADSRRRHPMNGIRALKKNL